MFMFHNEYSGQFYFLYVQVLFASVLLYLYLVPGDIVLKEKILFTLIFVVALFFYLHG